MSETPVWATFTKDKPCRCGFDGAGTHRCHSGRHPDYPGEQCSNEARPRLVGYPAILAGMQMKLGAAVACYCDDCYTEAFPEPS